VKLRLFFAPHKRRMDDPIASSIAMVAGNGLFVCHMSVSFRRIAA
jgi:hypothetical protein